MAIALIAAVAICMRLVMYPLPRFIYGIGYYRYHACCWPAIGCIAAGAAAALTWLPQGKKTSKAAAAAMAAAGCAMAIAGARLYGDSIYQTIRYLKMAHECKWGSIIADAGKQAPESPESTVLLNTALAFEHRLAGEMFRFHQPGPGCLVPELKNDMLHPLVAAEPLFWMGLNGYATHYYFEAKVGNPTYRPGWYPCMRLAECYTVSGDYSVAIKYLKRLQKTTFHKKMASEYISLIENGQVSQHMLFQALRSLGLKKNGLQSACTISESFKDLLMENPGNYLAYEYLMGLSLLEGNLDEIARNALMAKQLGYTQMPTHVQEAMACAKNSASLPVSPEVRERYMARDFGQGTFWHYYFNNMGKQK